MVTIIRTKPVMVPNSQAVATAMWQHGGKILLLGKVGSIAVSGEAWGYQRHKGSHLLPEGLFVDLFAAISSKKGVEHGWIDRRP